MSSNDRRGQYTTLRIAPSIYAQMNRLVADASLRNRKWSVSAFVNIALLDWIEKFHELNDKTVDGLFKKYEDLKTGHGGLLK
jgi:hypothetical protein